MNRQETNFTTKKRITVLRKHPEWEKDRKIRFLMLAAIHEEMETDAAEKRYAGYLAERKTCDLLLCGEYIKAKQAGRKVFLREIDLLNGDVVNDITPEMIERAKEHPVQNLHEFNGKGWGYCPFHEDHHPSLHVHNNRLKCWSGVCAWEGDSIAFVMKKEGKTFQEAVKWLQ